MSELAGVVDTAAVVPLMGQVETKKAHCFGIADLTGFFRIPSDAKQVGVDFTIAFFDFDLFPVSGPCAGQQ